MTEASGLSMRRVSHPGRVEAPFHPGLKTGAARRGSVQRIVRLLVAQPRVQTNFLMSEAELEDEAN